MEDKVIARPAIAAGRRMLAARGSHLAAVVAELPAAAHEARLAMERDLHAPCREREQASVEQARREVTQAFTEEIERAREAQEQGREAARRELEEAREAGREDGYRAGVEQALEEGRAAQAARDRMLEALLDAVRAAHSAALDARRDEAIAIGFAAACRVLGDALVTAEGVGAAVDHVLARLHAAEPVTVRLAPQDLARLGDPQGAAAERRIEFVADASLEPGGCCVDTSAGTLDARLRTQIEALHRALVDARDVSGRGEGA